MTRITTAIVAAGFAVALLPGVVVQRAAAQERAAVKAQDREVVKAPEPTFMISGRVASPGTFEIKDGMTMRDALATAGGTSVRADQRRIMLTRKVYGQLRTTSVTLGHRVRPGDKIAIESRP